MAVSDWRQSARSSWKRLRCTNCAIAPVTRWLHPHIVSHLYLMSEHQQSTPQWLIIWRLGASMSTLTTSLQPDCFIAGLWISMPFYGTRSLATSERFIMGRMSLKELHKNFLQNVVGSVLTIARRSVMAISKPTYVIKRNMITGDLEAIILGRSFLFRCSKALVVTWQCC